MLRFGTISTIDADKGLARVKFEEDGIVSGWLPILVLRSQKDKHSFAYDVNEHVACLMDEHAEDGVILGAIYSAKELPGDVKGADKIGIEFENGDRIEQDRQERFLRVVMGETELKVSENGPTVSKASESLKIILSDLVDAILAETHPTAMGPSGTPLNAATYSGIKSRINNFFEA